MCGIAGLFRPSTVTTDPRGIGGAVRPMTASLEHRGPDADGFWVDEKLRCAFGHRRLAIIDTSAEGLQPRISGDGRWVITFNGEIYNYQELRPQLEAAGVRLHGRTDTEVLIEAIALWGVQCLQKLDGMFAFAAFDTKTGELLLARDAFGEKPLYVAELADGAVAFGSELRAVEAAPGFQPQVDPAALAEYFSFQYIGAPRSIYRSVQKLKPGSWMRILADGRRHTGTHFAFRPSPSGAANRSITDLADELEELLAASLKRRLISDVPLGAFLSGGVDSSVVCALARKKLDRPLSTFCIGFPYGPESEHLTARAFAEHLGCDHHEQILQPKTAEFLANAASLLDEPMADSSCLPTLALSTLARQHVTVAISGDGGDELFGGYGRYFLTLADAEAGADPSMMGWSPGALYYSDARVLIAGREHVRKLLGFLPESYLELLHDLQGELNAEPDLLAGMRRSDVENYMPGAVLAKVDRMSMQRSLEVRTPFLDRTLARFAERLPNDVLVQGQIGKKVLKEVAYRYLPRELIDLPKRGFGLPMADWAGSDLLGETSRLIESDDSRLASMIGGQRVREFMQRQRSEGSFAPYQVWSVAILESWLRGRPAELPDLSAEGSASVGSSGRSVMNFFPVGAGAFVGQRDDADSTPTPPRALPPELILSILKEDAQATGNDLSADLGEAAPIVIPDWGQPLDEDTLRKAAELKDGILLFSDSDSAKSFDYAEYEKFSKLGVSRLVFPHPWEFGASVDITLGPPDAAAHPTVAAAREAAATLTMRVDGADSLPINVTMPNVGLAHSMEFAFEQDREMSAAEVIWEDDRQLPPIPTSHLDIQEKGRGRYSIWNRALLFSPTDPSRFESATYRVTPNAFPEDVAIPMRRALPKKRSSEEALVDLRARLATLSAPDVALKPGDPVVVCTHSFAPGGAERQWAYLAAGLQAKGYDVTFVTFEPLFGANAHYRHLLDGTGVKLFDATKMSVFDQLRVWREAPTPISQPIVDFLPEKGPLFELTTALRLLQPKAVFAQLDLTNLITGVSAHIADIPRVVLSFRSVNPSHVPHLYRDWYLPGYRALARSPRVRFCGNSAHANDDYAAWIGLAPAQVTTIHNALPPETFAVPTPEELAETRRELALPQDAPFILSVMRLTAEKGPLVFVEACAEIAKARPDVVFVLVGAGPMMPEVERRAAELGLTEKLLLPGRRDDVRGVMKLASLVMLTSHVEGMPNVLMEAQAMGTPVVSTRVGSAPVVAPPEISGLFAEPRDHAGLAAQALRILNDPALRTRMGEAGLRHVRENFDMERMVEGYLRVANSPAAVTAAAAFDPEAERGLLAEEAARDAETAAEARAAQERAEHHALAADAAIAVTPQPRSFASRAKSALMRRLRAVVG